MFNQPANQQHIATRGTCPPLSVEKTMSVLSKMLASLMVRTTSPTPMSSAVTMPANVRLCVLVMLLLKPVCQYIHTALSAPPKTRMGATGRSTEACGRAGGAGTTMLSNHSVLTPNLSKRGLSKGACGRSDAGVPHPVSARSGTPSTWSPMPARGQGCIINSVTPLREGGPQK